MVLSHGQHQHLIKAKDKHGPRSTAELISSPGSVGQLLSICPNTNLLFFTGWKKKIKTRPNLARQRFAWTSEEYDYTAVYICTSLLTSHRIASSRQALCGGLRARKVAKSRCERTQRRDDSSFWNIITILLPLSLSLSFLQCAWLWNSENEWDLYVGLDAAHSTWAAGFPCCPKQWKTISVVGIKINQSDYYFLKALGWKQNSHRNSIASFVMRAASNRNCPTAKTITSVCWKAGDNLFSPCFCCLSDPSRLFAPCM